MSWQKLRAKAAVQKAVAQFYDGAVPPDWPTITTSSDAERTFITTASIRGKAPVMRAGWPDFIVWNRGKPICVEVKYCVDDPLRETQRRCFAILERLGMPVFVWTPDRPSVLTPWRQHGKRLPRNPPTPQEQRLARFRQGPRESHG